MLVYTADVRKKGDSMKKIIIIGGTGYAGSAIAREAAARGHNVTSLSRTLPDQHLEKIHYVQGSAHDDSVLLPLLSEADVVVGAVSPRGDMAGHVRDLYLHIADETAKLGKRFVIIGGFSSLRPAAGQPRFFESGNIPAQYKDEALEIASIFDTLKEQTPQDAQWVFISPAAVFGAYADVKDTGSYRISTDIALFNEQGLSQISGGDFARGVVDEIEQAHHTHENISFVQ